MFVTFAAAILSTRFYWFFPVSALTMTWVIITGHNYFHRKDNFRMNYFNLGFMNYREWRVSHALSHHLYTNSLVDIEVSGLEPMFCWLPNPITKNFINKYVSWIYGPFLYSLIYDVDFMRRLIFKMCLKL